MAARGDYVIRLELNQGKFEEWYPLFKEHATSNVVGGITLKQSRGNCCDESKTEVYRSVTNSDFLAVKLCNLDLPALGEMMGSPEFAELVKDVVKVHYPPMKLVDPTASDSPPLTPTNPDILWTVEVKEFDAWYSAFKEHATSSTVMGLVLPMSRSEVCNEEKTVVMKHVDNKNKVAVMMAEVKLDTMRAGFEGCENWPKLHDVAGEIASTKTFGIMTDVAAPA